ncbi:S46 family peptidase [Odoribacter laneus]|uniref:S46 family peptidase n=1 Tax=Odoribacter laneus TaxID=626933 RepID=UPI003AB596DA
MRRLLIIVFALLSFSTLKADEGMWLLSLLKQQNIDEMQQMGFKLSAEDIYSVNKPGIKDAIVGLGYAERPFRHFCSGELVSPQGLMITNHHCGFSAIQEHSSVEHDYLSDGFWAYKMEDELTNPGITASILERMEDVTERVNAVLNDDMSTMEREIALDSISSLIVKEATENTDLSGQVISMFEGNQYFLFLYTIYKDVRLVGAPPQSLGKFGGDTDNWIWPRHTCDFSMFRIYTGPDGRPAEYSKDNIPLKPKHHLPVSIKGVEDGDFAMIMGFPGSTDRFATSFSLQNTMDIVNDIRYKVRTEKLKIMKEEMDKSPKTRIQYASKYASCANYWKYSFEQNKALKQLKTAENKKAIEDRFTAWVKADPARAARYAEVLPALKTAYQDIQEYEVALNYLREALGGPEAHLFAYGVAGELEDLCDKATDAATKEKLVNALKEQGEAFYKDFNPEVDARLFAVLFKMYSDNVSPDLYPDFIDRVNKKYKGDYQKLADEFYRTSIFRSKEAFEEFIAHPNCKKLNKDVAYLAGEAFYEMLMKIAAYSAEMKENIVKNNRLFVRGLMEMDPQQRMAPNANSTLRLTYGKVKSYKPRDAVFYDYYTTLTGVMEKEGPKGGEFEVPARLKELYKNKDFGQYGKDNVVTCFITDNDITGGNSGSPVINANGELIGAAFDGNSEAMSGDIDFEENLQRCINVDMRYVLFIIDKYAGAKNLIDEMTIVK